MMNYPELLIMEGLGLTVTELIRLKGIHYENNWSGITELAALNITTCLSRTNKKYFVLYDEATKTISEKCIPSKLQNVFTKEVNIPDHHQKNDLIVYESLAVSPVCIIEIKGIDPMSDPLMRTSLICDLQRNMQYFLFQKKHHFSMIKQTCIAYIRCFRETQFDDNIQQDLQNARSELESLIKKSVVSDGIKVKIETALIFTDKNIPIHFIGVIAVFG